MKTQIIHLEPHDDVISARDKMGWGQTGRILLVWPARGQLLTRRLDLVLLQRHSNTLGAQLALVTRNSEVRYHARDLAIPVFTNLRQAQRLHWRVSRRFRKAKIQPLLELDEQAESEPQAIERRLPERPKLAPAVLPPAARLAIFTFGVLALLSIAAVLLPSALLTLTPDIRDQEISLEVQANPKLATFNLSGALPAQLKTVIVEGRNAVPASGTIQFADGTARGQARFTNLTDQAVKIPAGTVMLTLERPEPSSSTSQVTRFATTRDGEAPAGPNQSVLIPIQALTPGRQANLPADRLRAIEGLLGTQLSVTNPFPTYGGSERPVVAPSAYDRQRVKESLFELLRQSALDDLRASLAAGDVLIPESLALSRTLVETYSPDGSQAADHLGLYLRAEYSAQVVSGQDLQALANAVLDANLPANFSPLPETLQIKNLGEPKITADSLASWKISASRKVRAGFQETQAVQLVLGLDPAQAQQRLAAELPLGQSPQISLMPPGWPRLPVLPFRIQVRIAQHQ